MKQRLSGSLPIQATEIAKDWDLLYWGIFAICLFFFVLVVGLMVYFAVKYRERPGNRPKYITHHNLLEVVWTVVPTFLVLGIFAWGWIVYHKMVSPPGDSYEVKVIGKQWLWQFLYDHGKSTINELYVPAYRPVKLLMTSEDVIHSFFIPAFRVKQDVVPGMYTSVWFEATVPGEHVVYCAEYCGTSHAAMLAKVIALEGEDWDRWVRGVDVAGAGGVTSAQAGEAPTEESLIEVGKKLSISKTCTTCHSSDGAKLVGPSYKGLFGSTRTFSDGSTAVADENYIRESILDPMKKKVKGYENLVMPPFQGLLTEKEITALMAYIKSLK